MSSSRSSSSAVRTCADARRRSTASRSSLYNASRAAPLDRAWSRAAMIATSSIDSARASRRRSARGRPSMDPSTGTTEFVCPCSADVVNSLLQRRGVAALSTKKRCASISHTLPTLPQQGAGFLVCRPRPPDGAETARSPTLAESSMRHQPAEHPKPASSSRTTPRCTERRTLRSGDSGWPDGPAVRESLLPHQPVAYLRREATSWPAPT